MINYSLSYLGSFNLSPLKSELNTYCTIWVCVKIKVGQECPCVGGHTSPVWAHQPKKCTGPYIIPLRKPTNFTCTKILIPSYSLHALEPHQQHAPRSVPQGLSHLPMSYNSCIDNQSHVLVFTVQHNCEYGLKYVKI